MSNVKSLDDNDAQQASLHNKQVPPFKITCSSQHDTEDNALIKRLFSPAAGKMHVLRKEMLCELEAPLLPN